MRKALGYLVLAIIAPAVLAQNVNLSNATPAAPSGYVNAQWQKDGSGNISAYVPGLSFDVTAYGAVADGSTNNATAITAAFTAANAVTSGFPTVWFHCQPGQKCQYNYGGTGTSAINPTIGMTVQCDPGVTLRYTGSAHEVDLGPSGLTSSAPYKEKIRVVGCRFTDSGTATQGIYVNPFVNNVEIDHDVFYDTPASASSTAFAFYAAGDNWDLNIHDNDFRVDNNTAINGFRVVAGTFSALDSQTRFYNNRIVCWQGSTGYPGCSGTSGIGIWVDGWGSVIQGNNLAFMQPDVRIGPNSPYTKTTNNYFESSPTSSVPAIQYGNPGDAANTYVDGLMIANNNFDTEGNASASFLGPTTANDLLSNVSIDNLKGLNISAASILVTENNTAGQTGNQFKGICTASGFSAPCSKNFNIHTFGSNIAPWLPTDRASYSDGLTGSGNLSSPWVNVSGTGIGASLSVTSGAASCSGSTCEAIYSFDLSANQQSIATISTAPTGTDQIFALTRSTGSSSTSGLSWYSCNYTAGTGILLWRNSNGSFTQLGSTYTTTTPVAGDQLIMESIGNVHTCYLVHSTGIIKAVGPVVDSNFATGYTGMGLFGTTGRLGAFIAKGLQ